MRCIKEKASKDDEKHTKTKTISTCQNVDANNEKTMGEKERK
jgi:hypothetical protein